MDFEGYEAGENFLVEGRDTVFVRSVESLNLDQRTWTPQCKPGTIVDC